MALQRSRGELPQGATILSANDAIEYQWQMIWKWKPKTDVWPFSYGLGILGALSAMSGIYINNHYRHKLRLMNYGKLSSYLPIVFLPTMMSTLFHQQVVTNDILIQKTACPLCVQLRAAGIQSLFSVVYPIILAPLGNFMFATRHGTYDLPFITQDFKGVFRVWKKFTSPIGNILFAIFAAQSLAAMTISYYEAKACLRVQAKLEKLEQYYDENPTSSIAMQTSQEPYRN